MKRFTLVPAVGLAVLSLAASADAQTRGWPDTARPAYAGERQSYNDPRRAAYDNGYREGVRTGEQDGRRGAAFTYQNERTYQRADKGYQRGYGDVERYRQSFRSGFAAGYADGYQRYGGRYGRNDRNPGRQDTRSPYGYPGGYEGRYPRGGSYYNPALENGARDGYEKGREDSDKRRSFDVLRHKWYREGDRNFDGRYGSREQYKDVYRQGFREGYERGYRDGRYR
jgi:flagellar biosynthesis/type III secretory pathway protein FliH